MCTNFINKKCDKLVNNIIMNIIYFLIRLFNKFICDLFYRKF